MTNEVTAAEQSSVVRTRAGDGSRGDRTALGALEREEGRRAEGLATQMAELRDGQGAG